MLPEVAATGAVQCRVFAALIAGLCLLACTEQAAPKPNLLFIVSDTFRADALDCERSGERTPALCALSARGVVFENTYAGGPWTLPSSVSMLTGSHATTYGMLPLEDARNAPDRSGFFHVPDDEILLADALAIRGYETIRFAEGSVAAQTNVFQGLADPEVDVPRAAQDVARFLPGIQTDVKDARFATFVGALQYLANSAGQPFFMLVWIHDPHAIYAPPIEYWKEIHAATQRLPHAPDYYATLGHLDSPAAHLRRLRDQAPFTREENAMLRRLYHAEVQSVDYRVGQLLEILRQRGLEENTIVVFTSDHGEGFGEHDLYLHGNSFYEELLRVPLILAGPRFPSGHRVTVRVSHIDLMPTLREALDVECLQSAQGRSLRPLLTTSGSRTHPRPLYAASPTRNLRDTLIEGDYKLIISERETAALYDLAQDPAESIDLAIDRPEVVAQMRSTLKAIRTENETRRQANLTRSSSQIQSETNERTLEQLRALGYVESGPAERDDRK